MKPKLILITDKELHTRISEAYGNTQVSLVDASLAAAGQKNVVVHPNNEPDEHLAKNGTENSAYDLIEAEEMRYTGSLPNFP